MEARSVGVQLLPVLKINNCGNHGWRSRTKRILGGSNEFRRTKRTWEDEISFGTFMRNVIYCITYIAFVELVSIATMFNL